MIRTIVIGHGFSAQTFHIPFLQASSEFLWTGSVSSKAKTIKQDQPSVEVLESIDEISLDQFDLAIVTTPNSLHFAQVKQLLELELNVVVEKPMVLSLADASALFKLAEQQGKVLTVFQNRRWDGDYLTIKDLLQRSSVGKVGRFISRFDRFRPSVRDRWRESDSPGAGILWDLGPHLIDQMIDLFGKPEKLTANISKLRPESLSADAFEIWCHYEGFEVVLGSSCFQAGPNLRFSIEGSQGTYIKYGLDVQEDALKRGENVQDQAWGVEPSDQSGLLYELDSVGSVVSKAGCYQTFWSLLAQAIVGNGRNPIPKEDALAVIELIELAYESVEQGRTIAVPKS